MEGVMNPAFVANENDAESKETGSENRQTDKEDESVFDSSLQRFQGVYRSLDEKKKRCMKKELLSFRNL